MSWGRPLAIAFWLLALAGVANAQCSGGISGCPPASTVAPTDWTVLSQPGGTPGGSGFVTRKATVQQVINAGSSAILSTANTWTAAQSHSASVIVPTPPVGDNSGNAASTAFVQAAIGASGGFSPGTPYTWTATQTYNASILVPARTFGDNTANAASTAFVQAAIASVGGSFSPGTPYTWTASQAFNAGATVPTEPPGNNTTNAASTAFVTAAIGALPNLLTTANTWTAAQTFGAVTVNTSFSAPGLVTNVDLVNPSTTVNGQTCTLGATCTVAAAAGTLTGTTLASGVTASSLTSVGTLTSLVVSGNLTTGITGSAQCLQVNTLGVVSGAGAPCGTGSGAVTSVSNSDGTLTVSPTTGAVVVSLNLAHANTWAGAQSFGAVTVTTSFTATGLVTNADLVNSATTVNGQACTLGSTCTVAAAAGTLTGTTLAAGVTGSSLTSVGTLTALSVSGGITSNITGSGTQCVQASATGVLSGTGAACGSGSGAVNSVTNADGTLTISPTTGAVVASLALGHANTWTVTQTFSTVVTPIINSATTLQFQSGGVLVGDYAVTNVNGWTFTSAAPLAAITNLLQAAATNAGFANIFSVVNTGTLATTGTEARVSLQLPGTANMRMAAVGGATPQGQILSLVGLTGGISIQTNAGPLLLNPNTTLQFQSNSVAVGDYGLTTASIWTLKGLAVTTSFSAPGLVTNASLANPSTTVNGVACTLGSTCTITATAGAITVGTTTVGGGVTNQLLYDNAGVLGEITKCNNGLYQTGATGIPSCGATLPNGLTAPGLIVTGSFTATGLVTNGALANSATTVNGQVCTLGATCTVAAAAGTLTGTTLASNVVSSSLTSVGTLTALAVSGAITSNITSAGTQCVQASSTGVLSGTGAACSTAAVNSVSNADGTLTVSPTTGAVVASLALGHANSWTATQTFTAIVTPIINSATTLQHQSGGVAIADYGLTTAGVWTFTTSATLPAITNILTVTAANTGAANGILVNNSGTSSNSATIARLQAQLSGLTNGISEIDAVGGATPQGQFITRVGLTGGLLVQSGAGPVILNANAAGTTLQFQVAATGVGDYGLTTASVWTLKGLAVTTSFSAPGLVTNASLANSSTTVNGVVCTLGSTCTVVGNLTIGTSTISGGTTQQILYDNAGVVGEITKGNNCVYITGATGIPSCGTMLPSGLTAPALVVTGSFTATGLVTNADLVSSSTQVNGVTCPLGGTCTVPITVATTVVSGGTTQQLLYNNGGVLGEIPKCNSGVYQTGATGIPSCGTTLPSGLTAPSLTITTAFTATGLVTNAALANPSTTVNTVTCTLGASCTVTAAAGTLTGTTLAAGVTASSLTSVGTLTALTVSGAITSNITGGGVQCVQASNTGVLSGAGATCAALAPVASVSNADGTLTISPTTGAVVASLALAHANTWTALQTFNGNIVAAVHSSATSVTLNPTTTLQFQSNGVSIGDYSVTNTNGWNFTSAAALAATTTIVQVSGTNTGFVNILSVINAGTTATAGTEARISAQLPGNANIRLAAVGGAAPQGQILSLAGLTAGISVQTNAGPVTINPFSTLQFQSNSVAIGDYGLTTANGWTLTSAAALAATTALLTVTAANTGFVNSFNIANSGTPGTSGTVARLVVQLSGLASGGLQLNAFGGATPQGQVIAFPGLTGGLLLQSGAGPVVINTQGAGSIQFQSAAAGVGDYSLTTANAWTFKSSATTTTVAMAAATGGATQLVATINNTNMAAFYVDGTQVIVGGVAALPLKLYYNNGAVGDYSATTANAWTFTTTAAAPVQLNVLTVTAADTAGTVSIMSANSGTGTTASTNARVRTSLSGLTNANMDLTASGGASPQGQVIATAGMTGGMLIQSGAGPIAINTLGGSSIQFQNASTGIADYNLTAANFWTFTTAATLSGTTAPILAVTGSNTTSQVQVAVTNSGASAAGTVASFIATLGAVGPTANIQLQAGNFAGNVSGRIALGGGLSSFNIQLAGIVYIDYNLTNANAWTLASKVFMTGLTTATAAQTSYVCRGTGNEIISVAVANTCASSSIKFKEDVADLHIGLSELLQLRPVSYRYRLTGNDAFDSAPGQRDLNMGFIAEEANSVDQRFVVMDAEGKPRTVRYEQLSAPIINALKELKADNDNMRAEIDKLKRAAR